MHCLVLKCPSPTLRFVCERPWGRRNRADTTAARTVSLSLCRCAEDSATHSCLILEKLLTKNQGEEGLDGSKCSACEPGAWNLEQSHLFPAAILDKAESVTHSGFSLGYFVS